MQFCRIHSKFGRFTIVRDDTTALRFQSLYESLKGAFVRTNLISGGFSIIERRLLVFRSIFTFLLENFELYLLWITSVSVLLCIALDTDKIIYMDIVKTDCAFIYVKCLKIFTN